VHSHCLTEESALPSGTPKIAVSSWSLHRAIGRTWWDSPASPAVEKEAYGPGGLAILDLPAAVAAHDITRLQLCHFHVRARDGGWIDEFRSALADAGVALTALLIDDGDISDPAERERDIAWTAGWIDTAAALGAKSARVIAGKQKPTPDALAASVDSLRRLAVQGKEAGVRIMTENWLQLLSGPDEVDFVLDAVGDDLGFLADFGNWKGPEKYAALARVMPRAEDTHAKAAFAGPGAMDEADFGRCIAIAIDAGYDGPYTLIYESADDNEWRAIATEESFVRDRLAAPLRAIA
jgi:sugar phosphate isomerase/epimerase